METPTTKPAHTDPTGTVAAHAYAHGMHPGLCSVRVDGFTGKPLGLSEIQRAANCFNACRGIPDPAAAIRQAREVMARISESAHRHRLKPAGRGPRNAAVDVFAAPEALLDELRAALAALGG